MAFLNRVYEPMDLDIISKDNEIFPHTAMEAQCKLRKV